MLDGRWGEVMGCGGFSTRAVCPLALILSFLALAACSDEASKSGAYVGSSANAEYEIQLAVSDHGAVAGRYEQTVLTPTGQVEELNGSISGQIEKETVVLNLQPAVPFAGSVALSGTLSGNILHVSGGGFGSKYDLQLSKADDQVFATAVSALKDRAQKQADDRAKAQAAQARVQKEGQAYSEVLRVTSALSAASDRYQRALQNVLRDEERFRTLTQKMSDALERERGIKGDGRASVARGQISGAISQASVGESQLHGSEDQGVENLNTLAGELRGEIDRAKQDCAGAEANGYDPLTPEAWHDACAHFTDIFKSYQGLALKLEASLREMTAVRAAEEAKQKAIVDASNRAVG
jgi:hypothetical protein